MFKIKNKSDSKTAAFNVFKGIYYFLIALSTLLFPSSI
ncbi:hypothetical protein M2372_002461 [Chryseobacterium sp. BIGb0232]|nr:hypothetical protein [Chryseobacterium sp. BIGb0232]ROS14693.1 hypothetical protein EDF65_3476 [Chryseobacterium nakagawai]